MIVPLVLAYCSQSRIIAALTQRWIIAKACSSPECLSLPNLTSKLHLVFRQVAAIAGISCTTATSYLLDNPENGFDYRRTA